MSSTAPDVINLRTIQLDDMEVNGAKRSLKLTEPMRIASILLVPSAATIAQIEDLRLKINGKVESYGTGADWQILQRQIGKPTLAAGGVIEIPFYRENLKNPVPGLQSLLNVGGLHQKADGGTKMLERADIEVTVASAIAATETIQVFAVVADYNPEYVSKYFPRFENFVYTTRRDTDDVIDMLEEAPTAEKLMLGRFALVTPPVNVEETRIEINKREWETLNETISDFRADGKRTVLTDAVVYDGFLDNLTGGAFPLVAMPRPGPVQNEEVTKFETRIDWDTDNGERPATVKVLTENWGFLF